MRVHLLDLVAAVLLVGALSLARRRAPRLLLPTDADDTADDRRPALLRLRVPLSALAAVGAWAFLGGAVGAGAALGVGWLAWRVLGGVESAAVVARRERLRADLPGAVDLLVTVLEAGAAPSHALGLVGEALGGPVADELGAVHLRIELGADPDLVWKDLARHPELGPLGRALDRAAQTGASVSAAGRRLATELREQRGAEIEARARAVSTKAAAPLGACFLPAFVLLGIVPLVAGLVGSLALVG